MNRQGRTPSRFLRVAIPLITLMILAAGVRAEEIWSPGAARNAVQPGGDGLGIPVTVHGYSRLAIDRTLSAAPRVDLGFEGAIRFPVPTPDGDLVFFLLVERPTLAPELQMARPDLRTYAGLREDDPRSELRLTRTPDVLLASVLGPDGWNIDSKPAETPGTVHMWRRPDDPSAAVFQCDTVSDAGSSLERKRRADSGSNGTTLRTYDFAMTGTGEFTLYHGSVAAAEAEIVSLVNFANFYFERELAVRFSLVDINVYPDPTTDPFTDGLTPNVLSLDENQSALDRKLGFNRYELGHVISRYNAQGWRGLAQPGAQCDRSGKARGATYAAYPLSSVLLEGILHECGHQLGALHSFNGTAGSCGANREPAWAYEIASGISWMSYAGICGAENIISGQRVQMYNGGSLESIFDQMAFTSDCGSVATTGNNAPLADAGPDRTIPRETAFVLDGSNSLDPDMDDLTFSWEQHDLGPPSPPYGPAEGPLFRNFAPSSDSERSFPIYSAYRVGGSTRYEILPTVDRTLTFRLVVRDNRPGGAGIGWDTTRLTVSGSPFRILSPNGGESFESGSEVPVSWQAGGGSVAGFVRTLFSSDQGMTWTEVDSTTANDGSHSVKIPCEVTTGARLRLEPLDNIFFDISNANFAITPDVTAPGIVCPPPFSVQATSAEGIDKNDAALASWINSAQVTDACDEDPDVTFAAPQTIPIGTNAVTFFTTDTSSNFNYCTTELTVSSATASPPSSSRTALLGVRPNPMNPRTVISFQLASAQEVRLSIYDVRGRLVAVVHDGILSAGSHDVPWDGSNVPSGAYVARLTTRDGVFTHRLALLK